MKRRDFVQTVSAVAAGAVLPRVPASPSHARKLDRIGLELYTVRREMAKDPERTLHAVRDVGFTDVELLWSFGNFGRTPAQVAATLKQEGLRAPSAHINPAILFIGWQRSLDTAKQLGHEYLIVPDFGDTVQTLDDWKEWADDFNTAGAAARNAGIWLAFHNEADHMKPLDASGQVPYDVFIQRLDPSVTRLQLDTGNMLIGGGDPQQYLEKYKDRYWSFHLKDAVADRTHDTRLGQGIFDFKRFLATVPNLEQKPCYVEDESPADAMAAARTDYQYLQGLDF